MMLIHLFSIAMCVEWCKAHAHMIHWTEEVALLQEEIRQVSEFLEWNAAWWNAFANAMVTNTDTVYHEGHTAYANQQSALRCLLCSRFRIQWEEIWILAAGIEEGLEEQTDVPRAILSK